MEIQLTKINTIYALSAVDVTIYSLASTRVFAQKTMLRPIHECFEHSTIGQNYLRGLNLLCQLVYHIQKDFALWRGQAWASNTMSESKEELDVMTELGIVPSGWTSFLRAFANSAAQMSHYQRNVLQLVKVFLLYLENAVRNIIQCTKTVERLKLTNSFRVKLFESYFGLSLNLISMVRHCLKTIEATNNYSPYITQENECVWEIDSKPTDCFPDILIKLGVLPPPVLRPKNTDIQRKIKMSASEFLTSLPDDMCTRCFDMLESAEILTILPHCQHVFCSSCLEANCENGKEKQW